MSVDRAIRNSSGEKGRALRNRNFINTKIQTGIALCAIQLSITKIGSNCTDKIVLFAIWGFTNNGSESREAQFMVFIGKMGGGSGMFHELTRIALCAILQRSALKIGKTKKRSSKLGVFSYLSIYS